MSLRTLVRRFAIAAAALPSLAAWATPNAYVSFSPSTANRGDPILLAISLLDSGTADITNAQLASGVFQFPAGMTTSTTQSGPVTNCVGGTVTSTPGSNTMSFTAPSVPATTSCGVTVYVDFAAPGPYTAALPANAITTDQGPAVNAQAGTITIVGGLVTNTNDSGPGSLRDAINTVNVSCFYPQTITFNIPGTGPFVIQPATALPAIACSNVMIDGYTQPGSSPRSTTCTVPTILVELSGSACGPACNGIELSSFGETIQGLAIHSWANAGISAAGRTAIYGNIIGADSGGNTARGNTFAGIQVVGDTITIGSGSVSQDNLIVANGNGIYVNGGSVAVTGNQIGGLANCAPGNGNGVGIFFDANAATSLVNGAYIHFSAGAGIAVAPTATARTEFSANSIADNGGIGIDLNNDGPSPNDDAAFPYDQDGGANGTQNYPTITAIAYDAPSDTTTVSGVLNTIAGSNGNVEVYQNTSVKPGITEGNSYLGSVFISTDAAGQGTFVLPVSGNVDNLSATARFRPCIDCAAYSSEYSPTITKASVAPPVGPQLSISPARPQVASFVGGPGTTFVLTATNTGDQDLTFSGSPPFVGSPASYAFVSSTCTTLKPLASCDITMVFSPTAAGAQPGTVTITSNDPKTPSSIAITGVGFTPPGVAIVTPPNPASGSTTTAAIQVSNPNPADIDQVTGVLTLPLGFGVVSNPPSSCPASPSGGFTVAAGATCTVYDVVLDVLAPPGAYTFTIGTGDFHVGIPAAYGNPSPISTTVTVVGGSITVAPTSLAFGSVNVGSSSAPQNIALAATGRVAVPLASVTAPAGYVVNSSGCAAGIPPTGCTLVVTFAPTTAGAASGTIVITAGGASYSVSVTGTATVPPPLLAATVAPSALTFAPRSVGTRSPPATVTLTNTGTSPLSVRGIAITGDFAYDSTCPVTTPLAPGSSCSMNVTFAPLITGTRSGTLTISTNDPASPHAVSLLGTGVILPTATIAADPAALDFGTLTLGSTSAPQGVTIANTGNADASVAISTTGPFALAPPPSGSTACGATLNAGASCVVAVTFTPVVVGGIPGTLAINSNASNPRVTVPLFGIGAAGPPPRALGLPGTIDFGTQALGLRSAARVLTLTNTTAQAVTVSDLRVTGDFSVDDGCPIVPARGACSVNVYFTPAGRGARTGQATITVAGDTRPYIVSLVGDGGANPTPVLSVTPSRIGFGNALVGPAGPRSTITLANPGEVPVTLGPIVSPPDFLVANHCAVVIPAGGSCTLEVAFFPRLTGLRAQALTIPSNAFGAPHKVELSGTGCSLPNAARSRIAQLVCQ